MNYGVYALDLQIAQSPERGRLIPTGRDSSIEQCVSNPFGRLHRFDLALAQHGRCAGGMRLFPEKSPGTVLVREGLRAERRIVLGQSAIRVVG